MPTFRRLSLPAHGALELLSGLALLAAPFALGFGTAGLVLAVLLGVLVTGLALAGPEGLPLATHLAFDQLAIAALGGAALGLAMDGDGIAAAVFAAGAVVELVLAVATKWSRPR